jgi:hypothetical protein
MDGGKGQPPSELASLIIFSGIIPVKELFAIFLFLN